MSGSFPERLLVLIHSSVFAFVLRLESDEVIHAGLVTIVPANEIPCMGEGRRNQGAHQQADGKKCFHQNKVTALLVATVLQTDLLTQFRRLAEGVAG